jgi:hypothetical protein
MRQTTLPRWPLPSPQPCHRTVATRRNGRRVTEDSCFSLESSQGYCRIYADLLGGKRMKTRRHHGHRVLRPLERDDNDEQDMRLA